jgi:hypothetical protein
MEGRGAQLSFSGAAWLAIGKEAPLPHPAGQGQVQEQELGRLLNGEYCPCLWQSHKNE